MINKLIYIGYMPLNEKVSKDFYMIDAIKHGFLVEYWDLSSIFFPNMFFTNSNTKIQTKLFLNFTNVDDQLKINNNESSLFIITFTYSFIVIKLFRLLTEYNCQMSYFARGALPTLYITKSLVFKKIFKVLIKPQILIRQIQNSIALLLIKIHYVKYYDFVYLAGLYGYKTIGQGADTILSKSKIIKVNYFDYDKYKELEYLKNQISYKYCVFLDEYLPYHPDFKMLGLQTVNPDSYFISLNKFFDDIEKQWNVKVIIAAHPKAEKYKTKNPFKNRKVYYYKTAELCKYAEFTILHGSSSVSYTVLNEKPCFFIVTNSIINYMPSYYQFIITFSNEIKQSLINVDDYSKNSIKNLQKIDKDVYKMYKYRYLTSIESENEFSKNIFISHIKSI